VAPWRCHDHVPEMVCDRGWLVECRGAVHRAGREAAHRSRSAIARRDRSTAWTAVRNPVRTSASMSTVMSLLSPRPSRPAARRSAGMPTPTVPITHSGSSATRCKWRGPPSPPRLAGPRRPSGPCSWPWRPGRWPASAIRPRARRCCTARSGSWTSGHPAKSRSGSTTSTSWSCPGRRRTQRSRRLRKRLSGRCGIPGVAQRGEAGSADPVHHVTQHDGVRPRGGKDLVHLL
jgi:hypothetical protein